METDTIIVSDWHLGLSVVQVDKIKKFLDSIIVGTLRANNLILNGDIFDLNWETLDNILKNHSDILQKIVRISQLGTKIIYILGNHDPLNSRQKDLVYTAFNEQGLNNIQITNAYQLRCNGYIYSIRHGHEFDLFIAEHPRLSDIADIGYRMLIRFDNWLGIGFTQNFIYFVRKFFDYSKQLERRVRRFLVRRPYHGIIIGHTHLPKQETWDIKRLAKIKTTKKIEYYLTQHKLPLTIHTKQYANSGDWVESKHCTYITLDSHGESKLIYFN